MKKIHILVPVLKILSYVLAVVMGAALMLAVFAYTGILPKDPGLTKLEQLQQLIEDRFIGEVDSTAMEDAAAEAMIDSLGDRWSHYISADEYESYKEQMTNSYVGVGITVAIREDEAGVDISQVYEDGPAEEAGLLAGDVIIAVDGEGFNAADLTEVSSRVRGTVGSTVDLTVLRNGEEMIFTVERRQIQVAVAEGVMLTDEIGLVTIANFDERCALETIDTIEALLSSGAKSLIFDVRNNPGGYKDELVKVLDYLLPEGKLFISKDYTGATSVDYSDGSCLDMPMVVLINSESYSAAEFFAAALSEYDVARTVGQQTCGKGYFQQTYDLVDGSAVGLSVGKYYTPNGVSLAGVGITPDVAVEVDKETFAAIYAGALEPEEDPQIQAAVELLE